MSVFTQKASTQADYDAPPAGSHSACLIGLIDLGTHTETYQGNAPKDVRKIYWLWEFDHTAEGKEGRAVIGREYSVTFGSKSGMRQMIENWRAKKFGENEEYDITKLLGKPCLLTITHDVKNEKVYAKLNNIGPLPKGMIALKPSRPLIKFDLDSGEAFPDADYLPWTFGQKLSDKFSACQEKNGGIKPQSTKNGKPQAATVGDDFEAF